MTSHKPSGAPVLSDGSQPRECAQQGFKCTLPWRLAQIAGCCCRQGGVTGAGLGARQSSCQFGRLEAYWPWLQYLQPDKVSELHRLNVLLLLAALVQAWSRWPRHYHAVMSLLLALSSLHCCGLRCCRSLHCSTSAHSSKTGASAGPAGSQTSPPSKMSYSSIL